MKKPSIRIFALTVSIAVLSGCGGHTYGKINPTEQIQPTATVGIIYSPTITLKEPSKATPEQISAVNMVNSIANVKNTIPYGLFKNLAKLHASGKTGLVTWADTQNSDYILEISGDTSCPAPTEAAVKGAAGVLVTGATFAFAPLGVAVTPMTHINAYITAYKKDKTNQIGKGLFVSSGSSVIMNCDKMMFSITEKFYEQQFAKNNHK